MSVKLKFRDLSPLIDVSFWFQLEHRKLHQWKLDEPTVDICVSVSSVQRNPAKIKVPNTVYVTGNSFETSLTEVLQSATKKEESDATPKDEASFSYKNASTNTMAGTLLNFNTPQQLDNLDKKQALQDVGHALLTKKIAAFDWSRFESEKVSEVATSEEARMALVRQCSEELTFLNAVAMWTYADLKTHNFQYIVAFPAVDLESPVLATKALAREGALTEAQLSSIVKIANSTKSTPTADAQSKLTLNDDVTPFVVILNPTDGTVASALPLTPNNASLPNALVVFNDPSELAEHPGWFIRNLLAAIRIGKPSVTSLKLLGLRDVNTHAHNTSVLFDCTMEALPVEGEEKEVPKYKIVGWATKAIEHISMGSMMNPAALAESSSRLNISLMKWRMMPALDLEKIKTCKALLLGSGTLGCNIARHLMMWGVNHITMVDRGRVSYSNPVRQTLFEVEDVVQGRNKCDAAVAALKRILPTVNATSVNMTIRMPGHRVDATDPEEVQKCKEDVEALETLIKEHDVVFELLDSREARWLPTVLATYHNTPVINTALGFDAYVVMRHGLRSTTASGDRLGCYFCNDVVAPVDSLTARTLDQQCTVTRPGVSAMASALTVEMLAALYNHPKFFSCPSYKVSEDHNTSSHAHGAISSDQYGPAECCLGVVPHQIRGSVADYSQLPMNGVYFPKCAACSEAIMEVYEREGFPFILKCLNDPKYIETITGLEADRLAVEEKYGEDWDDDGWDD